MGEKRDRQKQEKKIELGPLGKEKGKIVSSLQTGKMVAVLSGICSAEEILRWAFSRNLDLLAVESAGLCSTCFPLVRETPAICVIDNSDCSRFADTTVPLLKAADAVAITKGDAASPEDREALFRFMRRMNPQAGIVFVNGVTGQGTVSLLRHLRFPEIDDLQERPDLCGGRRSGPASRPLVISKKESGNVGIDPAGNGAMTG